MCIRDRGKKDVCCLIMCYYEDIICYWVDARNGTCCLVKKYKRNVQQLFQEQFPYTKVSHRNLVRQLTHKFRETGFMYGMRRSSIYWQMRMRWVISDRMLQSPSRLFSYITLPILLSQTSRPTRLWNYSCAWSSWPWNGKFWM